MTETSTGIAQLIDRIKRDGVEAAQAERDRILDEARREAKRIVDEGQRQAEALRQEAATEAEQLRRRMESELRMAARDFVAGFEQRIRDQIIEPMVEERLEALLEDPAFVADCIKEVCAQFAGAGGERLEVVVAPDLRSALEAAFTKELARYVDAQQGVDLKDEEGLVGFRLTRSGDNFAWDFTASSMTRELVRLIEPGLRRFFEFEPPRSA